MLFYLLYGQNVLGDLVVFDVVGVNKKNIAYFDLKLIGPISNWTGC
jgi:hypothetical protein